MSQVLHIRPLTLLDHFLTRLLISSCHIWWLNMCFEPMPNDDAHKWPLELMASGVIFASFSLLSSALTCSASLSPTWTKCNFVIAFTQTARPNRRCEEAWQEIKTPHVFFIFLKREGRKCIEMLCTVGNGFCGVTGAAVVA